MLVQFESQDDITHDYSEYVCKCRTVAPAGLNAKYPSLIFALAKRVPQSEEALCIAIRRIVQETIPRSAHPLGARPAQLGIGVLSSSMSIAPPSS